MTNRERADAILHYKPYDRMPVVAFGYWNQTVDKWADEGYITREIADGYNQRGDNSPADRVIMDKLGFDFAWGSAFSADNTLKPLFEESLIEIEPDGSHIMRDSKGLIVRVKPGVVSIPSDIGTSLTDRAVWENEYLPRLKYSVDRINVDVLQSIDTADRPRGLFVGSMYGAVRDMLGVEHLSYLQLDDPELYEEVIYTIGDLAYQNTKAILDICDDFDHGHFWEDICFKNGPLVSPAVFERLVGPNYKRITDLLLKHNIDIVSLDCDGCIDKLVPIWLKNGVNTMFPIEVGTWDASLTPWREQYGKDLRGIGGMDKRVFALNRAAVDAEIERLKAQVDLGGFIPCPDHRIAPDAQFELVQYYCQQFRKVFG